jgi:hypothetical protein
LDLPPTRNLITVAAGWVLGQYITKKTKQGRIDPVM